MLKRIAAILLALMLVFGATAIAEESESEGLFKHTHIWSLIPSSDTATCTKDGVKTYQCINVIGTGLKGCKEVKTEVSPAKGHQNITIASSKATCTAGATETKYCLRCGYTDVQTISKALGHKWDEGVQSGTVIAGTIKTTYTCETCAQTKTSWEPVRQPEEHVWGEWKTTKKAKCEAEGERTRACTVEGCTETQTEPIAALGHNYLLNGLETVQPTCTELGKNVGICTRCLKVKETEIPALGHKWEAILDIVVPATCTKPAVLGNRCERCELVNGVEIGEPLGHDYKLTADTATCTLPGIRTYTCTHALLGLCNDATKTEISPAKGHNVKEWATATEPGCLTYGKEVGTCENCKQQISRVIAPVGHVWGGEEYVQAPTCEKVGYVKDAKCAVCGYEPAVFDVREVPALGHDMLRTVVKEANCGEDGLAKNVCQRPGCGYEEEEVIPATGKHDYHLKMVSFLKFRYVCRVCGDVYGD